MKEFIIKLFIGIIVDAIDPEKIGASYDEFIEKLKVKVAETPNPWDDMAVASLLSNQDEVFNIINMLREMVDEKVDASESTLDDAIWEPFSAKIAEIIKTIEQD